MIFLGKKSLNICHTLKNVVLNLNKNSAEVDIAPASGKVNEL